jgi:hypothetical protein
MINPYMPHDELMTHCEEIGTTCLNKMDKSCSCSMFMNCTTSDCQTMYNACEDKIKSCLTTRKYPGRYSANYWLVSECSGTTEGCEDGTFCPPYTTSDGCQNEQGSASATTGSEGKWWSCDHGTWVDGSWGGTRDTKISCVGAGCIQPDPNISGEDVCKYNADGVANRQYKHTQLRTNKEIYG